jgi:hypothetical protein
MSYSGEEHLDTDPITTGPSTGYLENYRQAWEQQRKVDSPYSREIEFRDSWQETLDKYEVRTGRKVPHELRNEYLTSFYVDEAEGNVRTINGGKILPQWAPAYEQLKELDRQITELNDPDIPNLYTSLISVYKMQRDVEAKTGDVFSRQTTGGFLGSLAGGMVGSFSLERDPITVTSTPIGGVGRTAARRILSEMAIVGSAVAVSEATLVNPKRVEAGLPERSVLHDALLSAAFAGVIRGGFEGGGKLLRLRQERTAEAVRIADEDAAALAVLAESPQSPRARAGIELITNVQAVERLSPYGTGRQGMLRFEGELDEVARLVAGQTDTAVARVLPEVPFEFIQRDADLLLVKERTPELYARLEAAKATVADIEARSAEISATLERTTLPDAVRLVDKEAGAALDDLARIVNDPATLEPVRAAAELQAEAIVTRVGVDRVAKALNDSEIAPKQQVKRMKAERKAAVKRYREVYKEVEAQRGRMQEEQDFLNTQQNGKLTAQLSAGAGPQGYIGPLLRHEVVDATVAAMDEASAAVDDAARALIEPPSRAIGGEAPERAELINADGMVDIGLKNPDGTTLRVPSDFTFRSYGLDGVERDLSFGDSLRELQDDIDLDNAVRICSV